MSSINIENLSRNATLDQEATNAIAGGLFGIGRKIRSFGRSLHRASRFLHSNLSGGLLGRVARATRWALFPGIMGPTAFIAASGGRIGNPR